MRIIIAGGKHEADYIIKHFKTKKKDNKLLVVNDDPQVAKFLASENKVDVYVGDITKSFVYEDLEVRDYDLFIALDNDDTINYVACLIAKKKFGIRRCICTVRNPKNVELFRQLGINYVISATHLLAEAIDDDSSIDRIIKTIGIEHDKVILVEVTITNRYEIAHKSVAGSNFPNYANISCLLRGDTVIIPYGDTVVLPHDILIMVCAPENEEKLVDFITKEKNDSRH